MACSGSIDGADEFFATRAHARAPSRGIPDVSRRARFPRPVLSLARTADTRRWVAFARLAVPVVSSLLLWAGIAVLVELVG